MFARRLAILTATILAAGALTASAAFAADAAPASPLPLAPGEKIVGHSTTTVSAVPAITELLGAVQGVKLGADKATLTIDTGTGARPVDIEYGSAMQSTLGGSGAGGGLNLGSIAGLFLGLSLLDRVTRLARSLTRRER